MRGSKSSMAGATGEIDDPTCKMFGAEAGQRDLLRLPRLGAVDGRTIAI